MTWVVFVVILFGWLVWLENQMENIPEEHETDLEARCRSIKMILAQKERERRENDSRVPANSSFGRQTGGRTTNVLEKYRRL